MENKVHRLLVIDDEENLRNVVAEYAVFEEYQVDEAASGMEAIELCKENHYDAIILDIMMPRLDGFSTCKEIRKFSDTPILVLSARTEEYDKLFAFEVGADDYIIKPFSPKELMARIAAIIKRNNRNFSHKSAEPLKFGGLVIDITGRVVSVDGNKIVLTPKEYDLLFYLVENKNIALSRETLLQAVWGYSFLGDDRTIDTHIKNLRTELGPYRSYIVTLRGMGYKFEF